MSYILEALKKSEREREIGHAPGIDSVQEREPPQSPRWLWPALAVLAVNGLLLLGLLLRAPGEVEPLTADADAPAPIAQVAPPPVYEPPLIERVPAPPMPTTAAIEPMPEIEDDTDIPESTLSPVDALPGLSLSAPMEPAAVTPPGVTYASSDDDAPRWQDLDSGIRNGLPVPKFDVHVYADEPARRFVLINLRKRREGDTLDDGPTLERITSDGVVLSHRGYRYRVSR